MIDVLVEQSRKTRSFWSGFVRERMDALELTDRASLHDISESLAVLCEQCSHMPSEALSLLMARSFCAVGDTEAAGRILGEDRFGSHVDHWLEALSAEYPFPELLPLFSSQMLRPLRLNSTGTISTWALNLDRLHIPAEDRCELIVMRTLRILTEKAACVWQKTDGQGVLAIRGLHGVHDADASCSREILSYLQGVLNLCARKYGWSNQPQVLLLDL